jgi:uncharacterized protein YxjI
MLYLLIMILAIAVIVLSFSLQLSHQRYHQENAEPDERNVMDYGIPVRSLYSSRPVFTLHEHIDVSDDQENILYTADTKMVTLHDDTIVKDRQGSRVAQITSRLFSLHEVREIVMADGTSFRLSNELLHAVRDITNIEGLGWQIQGNVLQLNFVIKDESGNVLAAIGRKALSLHNRFSIDLYDETAEEKIVCIVIALEHMIADRQRSASTASSSSG